MVRFLKLFWLLAGLSVTSCSIPSCVVGAQFKLAPESRLPAWFAIPEGRSRDEFIIELTLYATGSDKMVMLDKNGKMIKEVSVKTDPMNPMGPYPLYVIVGNSETSEIIEHKKMEPIFYVSDDPDLRKKLESKQ